MSRQELIDKIEKTVQSYGGTRYGYGYEATLQNEAYNRACRDIQRMIKEDMKDEM